jgi:hypothetical protein
VARKRLTHLDWELPKQPGYWTRRLALTDEVELVMAGPASRREGPTPGCGRAARDHLFESYLESLIVIS